MRGWGWGVKYALIGGPVKQLRGEHSCEARSDLLRGCSEEEAFLHHRTTSFIQPEKKEGAALSEESSSSGQHVPHYNPPPPFASIMTRSALLCRHACSPACLPLSVHVPNCFVSLSLCLGPLPVWPTTDSSKWKGVKSEDNVWLKTLNATHKGSGTKKPAVCAN